MDFVHQLLGGRSRVTGEESHSELIGVLAMPFVYAILHPFPFDRSRNKCAGRENDFVVAVPLNLPVLDILPDEIAIAHVVLRISAEVAVVRSFALWAIRGTSGWLLCDLGSEGF